MSESRLYNHDVQFRILPPPPSLSLSLSLCLQNAQLNVTCTSHHVLPNNELSGSIFLSSAPIFMKKVAFWKVPSLHPFVTLLPAICTWTWATDGILMEYTETPKQAEKPCHNATLPNISYGLTRDRTRASAVRSWWLTACAMSRAFQD